MTTPTTDKPVCACVDRKTVLLQAAYELLRKQKDSHYVLDLLGETVKYDDADCDGHCLMEDIATELNIECEL